MICSLHCGGGCASGRATRPRASGAHRRAERSGLLPPTSSILPRPANSPSPPPFPFLSGLGAPPSPPFGGLPTDGRGRKRRTEANEKRELFPFLSLCAPFFFFRSSLLLFGFGRPSGGRADAGRGIGRTDGRTAGGFRFPSSCIQRDRGAVCCGRSRINARARRRRRSGVRTCVPPSSPHPSSSLLLFSGRPSANMYEMVEKGGNCI